MHDLEDAHFTLRLQPLVAPDFFVPWRDFENKEAKRLQMGHQSWHLIMQVSKKIPEMCSKLGASIRMVIMILPA